MEQLWTSADANQQHDIFDTLPTEVFGQILSFLSINDILNCRLVCRSWRDDPSMFLVLRKYHKPIHFRSNNDIKYFSLLMRLTRGSDVPFSKFAFEVDQDIALNTIQHFLKSTQFTDIRLLPKIRKRWVLEVPSWKTKRYSWEKDYGRSVQTMLFTASNLTSLYLVVRYGTKFPATTDASCAQAFRNLKKFKVIFTHPYRGSSEDPTMFEKIIKHSPHLKVLSLLYYPYFCRVEYNYPDIPLELHNPNAYNPHENIMRTLQLQKLPNLLSVLPSASTKVKLRLGIITDTFQNVCNQLVTLTPQPRITALAISLPTELNLDLKTVVWNWIQSLPLSKLKFFQDASHYDDVPNLHTNPFYTVHQLRLTTVTNITSNNAHFLFPNVKKLSVHLWKHHTGSSFHPDFDAFYALVKNLPHLESLKLTGYTWEVLTGEPYDNDRHSTQEPPYVLQRIKDFKGKTSGIDKNPIGEISKLKELQVILHDSMYPVLYASATGRLKRLRQLTFWSFYELLVDAPITPEVEEVTNLLRKYHDKVSFVTEVTRL